MIRLYVLLIFVCFCIYSNAQQRVYIEDISVSKDSIFLVELKQSPISYSLEIRAALNKNDEREGKSSQEWGIVWNYKTAKDYYYAKILCGNSCYGDFLDQRYADVIIGKKQNGTDSIIENRRFLKGLDVATGYNTILLECNKESAKIFTGKNELNFVSKFNHNLNNGKCGIYTNDMLHVMSLAVETKRNIEKEVETDWSIEKINNYLKFSDDKIEGFWEYLDRNNDDKKAKIGGRYKFAIVKDNEEYLILYISGAITNKLSWNIGMLKGKLKPTIFENHYDLVWYDSMLYQIETDAHADITDDVILNLQFPIYESSFRLYKIRKASN